MKNKDSCPSVIFDSLNISNSFIKEKNLSIQSIFLIILIIK